MKRDHASGIEITQAERRVDLSRRAVVIGGASLVASAVLGGCRGTATNPEAVRDRYVGVDGRNYRIAPPQGQAREIIIEARPAEIEIAPNRRVSAWTYDGRLPGTEIRVREGEHLNISVRNGLPQGTSVHWHGLPMRGTNSMDGVPFLTQQPIQTGATFTYDFRAEPAGTFIFHPHSGLQIERGLYGTLIVEPNREMLQYDREYVLVFDDWLDGSPEDAFEKLRRGEAQHGAMPGMAGGEMGGMPGMNSEGASGGGREGAGSRAEQMEEGADVAYAPFSSTDTRRKRRPNLKSGAASACACDSLIRQVRLSSASPSADTG